MPPRPPGASESQEAEPNYDDFDFAAALASFDREQAAESSIAANLTEEEKVLTGTLVKITDKHAIIDIRSQERRPARPSTR